MVWFKVDDRFHGSEPVKRIPREQRAAAIGVWTLAGTWSSQFLKDGFVPGHMLEDFGGTTELASALVDAGLWRVKGSGFVFVDWKKWQVTREEVEGRQKAERDRKAAWRAAKAAKSEAGHGDVPRDKSVRPGGVPSIPTRPDPTSTTSSSETPPRPDVERLCSLLVELIVANGGRKPTVSKAWRDSARLLLDRDRVPMAEAMRVMRWSQGDAFWRGNVLSMPTFREKFDQLRLKSQTAEKPPVDSWAGVEEQR